MSQQLQRIGAIIKIIANEPGIRLTDLEKVLFKLGVSASQKTIVTDLNVLKNELDLLPQERMRQGYFLKDITTVASSELRLVIDALSAFGVNLNDAKALEISRRLALSSTPGAKSTSLRQRNIYRSNSETDIDDIIFLAITGAKAVKITLASPRSERPVTFSVYPLFRVFHERGWYLISKNLATNAFYPSRIDRIESCQILKNEKANMMINEDVTEAQYLMNCGWGMDFPHTKQELAETDKLPSIVVRFDSTIAAFIREGINRHPHARIIDAGDGSGCLDFSLKLKFQEEFKHWVRSWGSKAWFIEPQNLVDEEKAEIRRKMTLYGI